MDPLVCEAWLSVLEKRFRSEKRALKAEQRLPKVLQKIILEYSRIDPRLLFDVNEKQSVLFNAQFPRLQFPMLRIIIHISHIGIGTLSVDTRYSCTDDECVIRSPHIGIHILWPHDWPCSRIVINIGTLLNYILTGLVNKNDLYNTVTTHNYKEVCEYKIEELHPLLSYLFDMFIWPIVQESPPNITYLTHLEERECFCNW